MSLKKLKKIQNVFPFIYYKLSFFCEKKQNKQKQTNYICCGLQAEMLMRFAHARICAHTTFKSLNIIQGPDVLFVLFLPSNNIDALEKL